MSAEATRTLDAPRSDSGGNDDARLALVIAWSALPRRLGEILMVPDNGLATFGRGEATDEHRLLPIRQRPGENERASPFETPYLSRHQLDVSVDRGNLRIVNRGKGVLTDREGTPVDSLTIAPGGCASIRDQFLFFCVERPACLSRLRSASSSIPPAFGEPDAAGIVGESPAIWALRDDIAFLAARSTHALILGSSGSGKELVAQAIHAFSARRDRRLIARNASTLPAGLVDAELFGNAANYPNQGMMERPGLIGEANGSTLFLDEIAELPEEAQTHLLRVLDSHGEYQRLGDARRRTSDLRVLAATNQPISKLRHDVAARFKVRLTLPSIDARREDIPLMARHLLRTIARSDAEIGQRFFDEWDGRSGEPRLAPAFASRLLLHEYSTGVRELEALLWLSIKSSRGTVLEVTKDVNSAMLLPRTATTPSPVEITADELRAALERAGGVKERAWRELGLASRYVLKRLIKKHGLADDEP